MAALSSLFRTSSRALYRSRKPLLHTPAFRPLSTKHPKGFVAPTEDELQELRERVQEFTSEYTSGGVYLRIESVVANNGCHIGREIPEERAAQTDTQNEFPGHMWKKLGEAG